MADDDQQIAELLGRTPRSTVEVVVRAATGEPVVIRNPPLLDDGTPMPTRYWLVGRHERDLVSSLEALGGVKEAAAAVGEDLLAVAHDRYAAERDSEIPPGWRGARPSGGVGGARRGVKCLHAHLAWFLAGGDDPVGRWVSERTGIATDAYSSTPARAHAHRRLGSSDQAGQNPPVAAIDCGSNSTRLLAIDSTGRTLTRLMRITRLGEGVDGAGRLAQKGLSRTAHVLAEFRREMDRLAVGHVRVVATSAVRDAANKQTFLEMAHRAIGVEPELLSAEEEGVLAYRGASAELGTEAQRCLVVDIGGGSTELAAPSESGRIVVSSLEAGCVRLTERFLRHDPPHPDEILGASAYVRHLLQEKVTATAFRSAGELVGLAGTVSALAAVRLGLAHYDRAAIHHSRLPRDWVADMLHELAAEPAAVRRQRGLEVGRADVIVGGMVVLLVVMEELGFDSCLVSESDMLDGIARSLLGDRESGGSQSPPAGQL